MRALVDGSSMSDGETTASDIVNPSKPRRNSRISALTLYAAKRRHLTRPGWVRQHSIRRPRQPLGNTFGREARLMPG
jgi:hypothetical protein